MIQKKLKSNLSKFLQKTKQNRFNNKLMTKKYIKVT